ncbi:unnamed protein product [Phaeothamnion confervicola]
MATTRILAVLSAALLVAAATAFVPRVSVTSSSALVSRVSHRSSRLRMVEKTALKDFNTADLQDDFAAALEGAKASVKEGKFGERGEVWVAAQLTLLFFILVGDVPFLGGPLEFLAGPGALLAGAALAAAGLLQLGSSLSPWPSPRDGNVLKTSGVFSVCRHPVYAGTILFALGLGVTTDSFVRIALAAVLAYVLDIKASKEEEALMQIHPAYKTYAEEVARFFPKIY